MSNRHFGSRLFAQFVALVFVLGLIIQVRFSLSLQQIDRSILTPSISREHDTNADIEPRSVPSLLRIALGWPL